VPTAEVYAVRTIGGKSVKTRGFVLARERGTPILTPDEVAVGVILEEKDGVVNWVKTVIPANSRDDNVAAGINGQ
jgi:ribosomal protein L27